MKMMMIYHNCVFSTNLRELMKITMIRNNDIRSFPTSGSQRRWLRGVSAAFTLLLLHLCKTQFIVAFNEGFIVIILRIPSPRITIIIFIIITCSVGDLAEPPILILTELPPPVSFLVITISESSTEPSCPGCFT